MGHSLLRLGISIGVLLLCLLHRSVGQTTEDSLRGRKAKVEKGGTASPVKTLTFDFETKQFDEDPDTVLSKLGKGDFFQVQINHINPLLYKVTTNLKDTAMTTAIPFPSFSSVGLDDLTKAVAALPALGQVVAPSHADDGTDFFKRISSEPPPIRTKSDVRWVISTYQKGVRDYAATLEQVNDSIDQLLYTYNKYTLYAHSEFSSVIDDEFIKNHSLETLLQGLERFRVQSIAIVESARFAQEKFLERSVGYQSIIKNDAELKEADEKTKGAFQKLFEASEKVKARLAPDVVQKYTEGIVVALNSYRRTYISMPMQVLNNSSHLTIHVVPRDEKNGMHSYTLNLLFPVDKRYFWGLSSGLYISRLHNKAYSVQTFRTSPLDTLPTYGVRMESPGRFEFGASAMVRFGVNTLWKGVGWQAGFGPALAVADKVRPRLIIGTGPAFGKNHKLLIDVGCTFGYVDRLSNVYATELPYNEKPSNIVVSKLRAGMHVSLNYMFYK
ncbi:hypothetical protein MUN82_07210 [Hymenobacter aerilatus]|uniref:Uncharacterized protein n=1 Tax=Hymenobacter aerilatus TaxID=2932251 RepID=A0A8T9SZS5_9BACT|nr:hypothetical protein [Hymenobacter aerilatus]UOR06881.1 hypothetical protein MUN82_07210 [Hymenobacter aerilatus]